MRSDESREVKPGLRGERDGDSATRGMVSAEGTMGERESVPVVGAEDEADDASAKANRKEADEPEREEAEKSAVRGREVPYTGTMGDGGGSCAYENTMGDGAHGEPKYSGTM